MTKIGICFGGYCPLHQGHMDVIMKAKKENDICYVVVCGYDNEPRGWEINLDLDQRFEIINEYFKGDEQIRVRKVNDTELGIDESMSDNNWTIWQNKVKTFIDEDFPYIEKRYAINANGRAYKQYYANHPITWYVAEPYYKTCIEKNNVLNASVELIEKLNPVSGTQVRKNPIKYWNKVTKPFKKYLTKNILIVGTASEGKSTLVKDICKYFDIRYAEEYGRTYIEEKGITDDKLTLDDFKEFIHGQYADINKGIENSSNGLFVSDTDGCVTLMYAAAYAEREEMLFNASDYVKLLDSAIPSINSVKWDHIFVFPPSKAFVNDGSRYMGQASMDEREKNFMKLQKFLNLYYPEVSKTYLNGSFYENFLGVKNYINSLIES